tara:strand:+ start:39930 stop:40190 length:261 start_codon:yes stop_codon:yes gene_type:complete
MKYLFARTTKACIHTTKSLKDNKHIIPDIIKDEFNKDLFTIKCGENHDKLCLKDRDGQKLEYVVFVNEKTKEKYHEHICNLNQYTL